MSNLTRVASAVAVVAGLLVAAAPPHASGAAGNPGAGSDVRVAKAFASSDRSTLREDHPGEAFWNSGAFTLGTRSQGDGERARSIWRFDVSRLAGKKILGAELMTVETGSGSCTPQAVQVWRTTRISRHTTWRDQPTWADRMDSRQAAHGFSSACPTAPLSFDVTSAVAFSAKRSMTWTTLGLRAADETDREAWKRFEGDATLAVNYATPPNAPVEPHLASPVAECGGSNSPPAIGSLTPTLAATPRSPDAGASLAVKFRVWDESIQPASLALERTTMASSSGVTAQVTVPSKVLSESGHYSFTARTIYRPAAGTKLRSPWTEGCHFTVDTVAPTAPLVTSTEYSECSDTCVAGPASGEFTFSSPLTADVVSYVYTLSGEAPVTVHPAVPGGDVTISLTPGAGIRTLSVNARDAASNTSVTVNFTFRVSG